MYSLARTATTSASSEGEGSPPKLLSMDMESRPLSWVPGLSGEGGDCTSASETLLPEETVTRRPRVGMALAHERWRRVELAHIVLNFSFAAPNVVVGVPSAFFFRFDMIIGRSEMKPSCILDVNEASHHGSWIGVDI